MISSEIYGEKNILTALPYKLDKNMAEGIEHKSRLEDVDMTREQAIQFSESGWWKEKTPFEITALQLYEPALCLPNFSMFQEAVETSLGRPVFTHEFADTKQLQSEFEAKYPDAETLKAQMEEEKADFCLMLDQTQTDDLPAKLTAEERGPEMVQ